MKKTFKTYLTESQRLPHWPKTLEELKAAYVKICVDPNTGEVLMPVDGHWGDGVSDVIYNDDLTVTLKPQGPESATIEKWMLVDGYLPFPFKECNLPFEVANDCELKSLAGLPEKCESISYRLNALAPTVKNLVGGPKEVNSFSLEHCSVESLEGFPKVDEEGSIFLTTPSLKDFSGIPRRIKHLTIGKSQHFTHESFEHLPQQAELIAFTDVPNLHSLHNLHKHVKTLQRLGIFKTKITSAILGLALIKGLEEVDPEFFNKNDMSWRIDDIENIVDKYIGSGEIFDFQEALEEAGEKELAKL